MKNIYLIPTDKASEFYSINGKHKLANSTMAMDWYISSVGYKPHNIYITSKEEDFNENDYVIKKDGRLVKVSYLLSKDLDGGSKVVIASDPDLIADGVQAIDDEFLEWFVKNPSCEFVEVNKLCYGALSGFADAGYKIIIPQEEPKQEIIASEEDAKIFVDTLENPPAPNEKLKTAFGKQPKQETLEEAAETYLNSGKVPNDYQSFIAGAKWQAERRYSEEEVIKSFDNLGFKQITSEELNSLPYQPFITDEDSNIWVIDKEQWFEQFKNK